MGQDELDLVEPLAPAPILDSRGLIRSQCRLYLTVNVARPTPGLSLEQNAGMQLEGTGGIAFHSTEAREQR